MALTSIRLKNFKFFADSGDIPLAPLTVIFGRNNTGKSIIVILEVSDGTAYFRVISD